MSTPTLLHLDASPRGQRSHSRKLGEEFVSTWQSLHPTGRVVPRDLGQNPPPFVTEAWVEAAFTPPDGHSSAAREAIQASDRYVDELLAADELLITTPIYNLSIPANLKAWIDQIVRFGRTFAKTPDGFAGLVTGKRVTVLVASGSDFRAAGLPAGTVIGHVHLRTGSLAAAESFYTGPLGLDVSTRDYPGALFLGADGYHHHIAVNTWGRPASAGERIYAGLERIEIALPDLDAPRTLTDPDGLTVALVPVTARP